MANLKEKQKFEAFLKSHEQRLKAELARALTEAAAAMHIEGAWPVKHPPENLPDAVLNIFETVYSRIIPFPFDGFLTVRGNAAKECRDITVELFKGAISHEWFTTKPKPLQNRFTADDRKVLADWQQKIEARLEEIGINHHIVWFQNQSRRIQAMFVERIVALYKQSQD